MTSNRILAALVEARALLRSEGNPNHDDEGKFASSPGGHAKPHGKHWAKKQRRKAKRKANLEGLRKEYKQAGKDLKKGHRSERKELTRDQRKEHIAKGKEHAKDRADQRKYEAAEKKTLLKDHKKTHAALLKEHGKERAHEDKQHEKSKAKIDAMHTQAHAELKAKQEVKAAKLAKSREQGRPHEGLEARLAKQTQVKGKRIDRQKASRHKDEKERHEAEHAELKERHQSERDSAKSDRAFDRAAQKSDFKDARKTIKEEHKSNWEDLKKEHHEQRDEVRERHKEERQDLLNEAKEQLREEFPKRKRKHNGEERSADPGYVGRAAVDHRRFGSGRTAKASSAEAILRHCLRQRGWTGLYARGQLTGRQRLRLLEDIRKYARAWLRHEAEAFMRQYGRADDESRELRSATVVGDDGDCAGIFADHHETGFGSSRDLMGDPSQERGLAGAMARHVGRFFDRAKSFVHEAILAGSLTFFSPADDMTEDDMRHMDAEAQAQSRYFDRFHQEVVSAPPLEIAEPTPIPAIQPMTAKQFVARAEQYGDAVWGAAQEVNRKRMIRGGVYVEERRVHGKFNDEMCATCHNAVQAGWQPIGTLPRIGDSECGGNCHCFFQFADIDGNKATTVRKLRRKAG